MIQSIIITDTVIMIGTICKMFQNLPFTTIILSESKHTLLMHCLPLFLYATISQQGFNKKVTKPFNRFLELSISYLEVIVCLIICSICVIIAWIQWHKLRVLIMLNKLSWTHEEHVLEKMSQSKRSLSIFQTSNTDWNWTCCFLCFSIWNK